MVPVQEEGTLIASFALVMYSFHVWPRLPVYICFKSWKCRTWAVGLMSVCLLKCQDWKLLNSKHWQTGRQRIYKFINTLYVWPYKVRSCSNTLQQISCAFQYDTLLHKMAFLTFCFATMIPMQNTFLLYHTSTIFVYISMIPFSDSNFIRQLVSFFALYCNNDTLTKYRLYVTRFRVHFYDNLLQFFNIHPWHITYCYTLYYGDEQRIGALWI